MEELVSNIGVVEKLQNFQYKDAKGKDWGLNVRNRAKELANFVLNPDRVKSERAKVLTPSCQTCTPVIYSGHFVSHACKCVFLTRAGMQCIIYIIALLSLP